MRLFTNVTLFLATILLSICFGTSVEQDKVKSSYISRRAIDGTRGRKYFDPQEDGFLDDYGFEKGQYHGIREKFGFSDIRSNVPGEPGVDYPAYVKIPKTAFSCFNRNRGYYADEDAGCQVFHVCDDGLTSSFLCPVGSVFSQQLLTCDWWSRVSCSESHKYYGQQRYSADISLNASDMLHQALTDTTNYRSVQSTASKKKKVDKTTPIFVSIRRNENQLESGSDVKRKAHFQDLQENRAEGVKNGSSTVTTKALDQSSIIKIKTLADEKRRSKTRGNFRLSSNIRNQPKFTSQDNDLKFFPSTESIILTTMIISDTPTSPKENSLDQETTTTFSESLSKEYQDNTSINILNNLLTKRKLETSNEVKNRSKFRNSPYEYDEMEGKETIGLINSHSERNLESEEGTIKLISNNGIKSRKTTGSVFRGNSTFISATKPMKSIKQNTQTKSNVAFRNSKIQELNFYDNEKMKIIDNLQKDIEQRIRKIINPNEEIITDTPLQYPTESSTLLYSNAKTSTGLPNFDSYSHVENTHTSPIPNSRGTHKISNFEIDGSNNKTFDTTNFPFVTIQPSDYQYGINSTNAPFTAALLPPTIQSLPRQQTTLPGYIKRITDTVQESNSPFEVTFSLNDNNSSIETSDKNPIGVELLGRLISHQEKRPVRFEDLEIVKSDQINQKININENEQRIDDSPLNLKTLHNFNSNSRHENQQIFNNYRPQSEIIRNLKYQSQQNENNDFQPLLQSSRNSQYVSITTTPIPLQHFDNYQADARDFKNKQVDNDKLFNNFRNVESPEFISTTDRSLVNNEKEFVDFNSFPNQQKEHSNYDIDQNQSNDNQFYNNQYKVPDDTLNYRVNYQTHHYPKNIAEYKQNSEENYKSDNAKNYNYASTENIENFNNYQSTESYNNYKNQYKTLYVQNNGNRQINNYPVYRNYENTEDVTENSHFKDFGARIASRNKNINVLNAIKKKPVNSQVINRHTINPSVQEKGIDFLWTMSQLVKNDRLPRPFVPEKNNFDQNLDNKEANYQNNIYNVYNTEKNNLISFNNYKEVPKNDNNYNNYNEVNLNKNNSIHFNNINYNDNFHDDYNQNFTEGKYKINVDNFAAPRFELINKDHQNQNVFLFSNLKSESVNNLQPIYGLGTKQNLNEPREQSYAVPPSITENPFQILSNSQSQEDFYVTQRSSEVNDYSFDNNQQFAHIPQPNFNEFIPENIQPPNRNIQVANENIHIVNNPRSHTIDGNYQKNTDSSIENIQVGEKSVQNHPRLIEYNFPQTTQQNVENNRWSQEIQSQPADYEFRPTLLPSEINVESQDYQSNDQRYNSTESSSTWKSIVETEFIPSLSFDFGSDEGMKEYLEALKKGLVSSDTDSTNIDEDITTSINSKIGTKEEISRSRKSDKSKVINNFKDTGEAMSKTE